MSASTTSRRAIAGSVGDPPTHFEGPAVVHGDHGQGSARVELVGFRPRHSVGGRLAEGIRRWRGTMVWSERPPGLRVGATVTVTLDSGRTGMAVVDDVGDGEHPTSVRGMGPPPFHVP